jgi:hypothetical protein
LKPALIDVPVLLIFFSRPDTFKKVFEKVKEARPTKLFLACDGPRDEKPGEKEKVLECQKIAEDIDWECEVHTNYSEKNMGCGMRPQTAITWAFSFVNRLVVLEDDCVPHNSFFIYMNEMLEKYKDDTRVGLLSGFNHFLNWDCGEYSYFFTKNGPMAGAWGTWKRVWDQYDFFVKKINDPLVRRLIENDITFKRAKKSKIKSWQNANIQTEKSQKISYWDVQFGFLKFYQSYLSIVPKFSLASNIGLGIGSTHAIHAKNIMPSIFFTEDRNLKFPLKHTPFIICDHVYDNETYKKWFCPHPLVKNIKRIFRVISRLINKILPNNNP